MTVVWYVVVVVLVLALLLLLAGVRLVQQYQRGIVLRFGRLLPKVRVPGLQASHRNIDARLAARGYTREHGEDDPAITGWTWPGRGRTEPGG